MIIIILLVCWKYIIIGRTEYHVCEKNTQTVYTIHIVTKWYYTHMCTHTTAMDRCNIHIMCTHTTSMDKCDKYIYMYIYTTNL